MDEKPVSGSVGGRSVAGRAARVRHILGSGNPCHHRLNSRHPGNHSLFKVFPAPQKEAGQRKTFHNVGDAQSPGVYILILVFILVSGALCPPVNNFLKSHLVTSVPLPVIGSTFKFGWISNAALMLFTGQHNRRQPSGG